MNTAAVLQLLLMYGPSAVSLAGKLVADVQAGKGNKEVTAADWDELLRLSSQTSSDIYKNLGITPPPSA